jgi:membrane protein DedA with SNARE-associated domain
VAGRDGRWVERTEQALDFNRRGTGSTAPEEVIVATHTVRSASWKGPALLRKAVLVALILLFLLPFVVDLLDIPDALVDAILQRSALAVPFALLAGEEAGVPLPVPGDVVIAYIGYRAAHGAVSYPLAFVALMAAVLVGSSILYYASSRWGQALVTRLGKYMHLSEAHVLSAERRFQAHGPWFIIIGRHIPGLRIPITVFCGISQVSYRLFLASTTVSVVVWIAFWLMVGSRLGKQAVHLLHSPHWYTLLIPIAVMGAVVLTVRAIMRVRLRLSSAHQA